MTTQQREVELVNALEPVHKGANWFYWVVGLSLVNLVLAVAEADRHFLIGLAMSEFASGFIVAAETGTFVKVIGAVIVAMVLGVYLLIGRKAHKPSKLAFIIGMVLYGLDGLIYIAFEDYLSAAFHGYVLYNFWMGYKALENYFAVYNHEATELEPVIEEAVEAEPVLIPVANETAAEDDPYKPII